MGMAAFYGQPMEEGYRRCCQADPASIISSRNVAQSLAPARRGVPDRRESLHHHRFGEDGSG
jgi:hypothetical protein